MRRPTLVGVAPQSRLDVVDVPTHAKRLQHIAMLLALDELKKLGAKWRHAADVRTGRVAI